MYLAEEQDQEKGCLCPEPQNCWLDVVIVDGVILPIGCNVSWHYDLIADED